MEAVQYRNRAIVNWFELCRPDSFHARSREAQTIVVGRSSSPLERPR